MRNTISWFVLAFTGASVSWFAMLAFTLQQAEQGREELTAIGQVGDSFGVINSLFSALAFSGVIWSMASQREQSRVQRVEFDRQSFDGSFFPFLASLRQTQGEFRHAGQADVEAVTGFVAANRLKDDFIAHINHVKTEPSILDDQTGRLLGLAFENYIERNAWFLEIYPVASHVKSLLNMIEHLEDTYRGVDLPFRKEMYIEIVRGQLNSSWMALLLLHGLSADIELKLQIDQSDLARHMRKGETYKLCAPYYSSLASPSSKDML